MASTRDETPPCEIPAVFVTAAQIKQRFAEHDRQLMAIESPRARYEAKRENIRKQRQVALSRHRHCQASEIDKVEEEVERHTIELYKLKIRYLAQKKEEERDYHRQLDCVMELFFEDIHATVDPNTMKKIFLKRFPEFQSTPPSACPDNPLPPTPTQSTFDAPDTHDDATANSTRRQKRPREDGAGQDAASPPKTRSSTRTMPQERSGFQAHFQAHHHSSQAITEPQPDGVYIAFWRQSDQYFPVWLRDISEPHIAAKLDLEKNIPKCFKKSPRDGVLRWKKGYELGESNELQREFPVVYFGAGFPDRSSVGWVKASDLNEFNSIPGHLVENHDQARTFLEQRSDDMRACRRSPVDTVTLGEKDVTGGDTVAHNQPSNGDLTTEITIEARLPQVQDAEEVEVEVSNDINPDDAVFPHPDTDTARLASTISGDPGASPAALSTNLDFRSDHELFPMRSPGAVDLPYETRLQNLLPDPQLIRMALLATSMPAQNTLVEEQTSGSPPGQMNQDLTDCCATAPDPQPPTGTSMVYDAIQSNINSFNDINAEYDGISNDARSPNNFNTIHPPQEPRSQNNLGGETDYSIRHNSHVQLDPSSNGPTYDSTNSTYQVPSAAPGPILPPMLSASSPELASQSLSGVQLPPIRPFPVGNQWHTIPHQQPSVAPTYGYQYYDVFASRLAGTNDIVAEQTHVEAPSNTACDLAGSNFQQPTVVVAVENPTLNEPNPDTQPNQRHINQIGFSFVLSQDLLNRITDPGSSELRASNFVNHMGDLCCPFGPATCSQKYRRVYHFTKHLINMHDDGCLVRTDLSLDDMAE